MPRRLKVVPHRRRRDAKTDYRQRLSLLKSGKPRLVIRKSNKGVFCHIVEYKKSGDSTLVASTSKELTGFGWNGNLGNLPAAYLTGLLCGKKAKEKSLKEVVFDAGLYTSVKGSRIYAALKGVLDAGLSVPHSGDVLPDEARVSGSHISGYAGKLKKESPASYKKLFSGYLKNNIQPENLDSLFQTVKAKILGK